MSVIDLPRPASRPDRSASGQWSEPVSPSRPTKAAPLAEVLASRAEQLRRLVVDLQDEGVPSRREGLFVALRAAVQAYTHALEVVCYQRLIRSGGAGASACREGSVYHDLIATVLDHLHHGREKSGALWSARLQVLRDLLDLQVERDLSRTVALLGAVLPPAELLQVRDEFVSVSAP